jgi:hypothetical protein
MRSTTRRRWYAATIGAVVVGGVLAGGVVGAAFQDPAPVGLEEALATQPLVKVTEVPAAPGVAGRGVFMQAAAGLLCVWESPSAGPVAKDGGCNPLDDPLAGRKMMFSFGYEGGPSIRGVRDARLVGIASLDVADIQVVMTDGSRRDVATRRTPKLAGAAETFRAFGYRLKTSDLKRGVGPTAVVALDAAGYEIDRQATGFAE